MEHSKMPWRIGAMESGQAAIDSADGKEVTGFIDMDDARRILACVNACAGIRVEALERRMHAVAAEGDTISLLNAQLTTERASLFAENQRKQQMEQQVEELLAKRDMLIRQNARLTQDGLANIEALGKAVRQRDQLLTVLEAMLEEVAGCYCTTEAAARAVIQKVRVEE